jgi:hypothetical protein
VTTGLTTIAALPRGAGCAAALPAEVGAAPTGRTLIWAASDCALDGDFTVFVYTPPRLEDYPPLRSAPAFVAMRSTYFHPQE